MALDLFTAPGTMPFRQLFGCIGHILTQQGLRPREHFGIDNPELGITFDKRNFAEAGEKLFIAEQAFNPLLQ